MNGHLLLILPHSNQKKAISLPHRGGRKLPIDWVNDDDAMTTKNKFQTKNKKNVFITYSPLPLVHWEEKRFAVQYI